MKIMGKTKSTSIEKVQKDLIRKQLNELLSKDMAQIYKRPIAESKKDSKTGNT